MSISGFSFARNADKLGYPIVESIKSILPICDEFIIAIGNGDPDDRTRELVSAIADPKIKIIDTIWPDASGNSSCHVYRQQTDIALAQCCGDWCFYLQCDEVVHEQYLPIIQRRCQELVAFNKVDGLLFRYKHFWGDYDHYHINHKWYPNEIRIIRNKCDISSWSDAQSFRKKGQKIRVAAVDAEIFHYGFVRHPRLMQTRNRAIEANYWGKEVASKMFADKPDHFDYGPLDRLAVFNESYPQVMNERIASMDWKELLQYSGPNKTHFKHDRLKYRILTFIEQRLLGGRQVGGYRNYILRHP